MPKIAAVLFDLDETLLDRISSVSAFVKDQYARFAHLLGQVDQATWHDRFLALDSNGSVHKSFVYPAILAEFGGVATASQQLLTDYVEGSCRYAQPFLGMAATLAELRRRGMKLGIVTNGETTLQTRNIQALDLHHLVDEILISEAEQLRKPDAKLFQRAAKRLNVSPEQCVYVGDNPVADVMGAHAAGLRAVWFSRKGAWPEKTPAPGPIIHALPEVLSLLD